jgi:predicted anti-sigma-YlaC factor YlaD
MDVMKKGILWLTAVLAVGSFVSCGSIERAAVRSVANMLSSPEGSGAFTSDNDPQLVGDSLPLALKLYEIILQKDPENADLAAATGKNFVMYSGAFVQMPADMLDDMHWKEADEGRARAKKLYKRGRDYLLEALYLKHEDFQGLLESGDYDAAMALLDEEDADTAYWAGLGWLGMASTDPFDMELSTTLDKAALLLFRSMELDEANPGIHDIMIQLQLSLPSSILVNMRNRSPWATAWMDSYYKDAGIDENPKNRAFYHYYRTLALSDGTAVSPHLTMATALAVKEQDVPAFRDYIDKALSVDPDSNPDSRLMILIYQKKARWLLDNIENFFLVDL